MRETAVTLSLARKPAVLVVDDDPRAQLALEGHLESDAWEIVSAGSGEEALLRLGEREFALMITDIQMPGIDGINLVAQLQDLDKSLIPVLFQTAVFDDAATILRAYQVGGVDFLAKPLNPEILRAKVKVFVDLWLARQELSVTNRQLQTEVTKRKKLERKAAGLLLHSQSLNEVLELTNLRLEKTSQYKTEFLANMSHELRTPLNAILLLTRLMEQNKEGNLSAGQLEYLRYITEGGEDLLALIDEILDLSKIEAKQIKLLPQKTDLSQVRDFAERSFRPTAKYNGLEFLVDMAPDLPASIHTDRQRLEQVLRNLLSNAFKFTEVGRVSLSIAQPTVGILAFSVSDTGIGIPHEKHQLIWEAFQQEDSGISRKYGGTGLGLTISRDIARLLGGEIQLDSEPGQGSTFTLYLPEKFIEQGLKIPAHLNTVHAAATIADIPSTADVISKLSGRTVLLVDDNQRNRHAMKKTLESYGMAVVQAENGQKSLAQLRAHPQVDAVLMDMMMPVMDGFEATRRIRQEPAWAKLPVIAVTARAMKQDRVKCLEAGATDYLSKPVNIDQLLTMLYEHLKSRTVQ